MNPNKMTNQLTEYSWDNNHYGHVLIMSYKYLFIGLFIKYF